MIITQTLRLFCKSDVETNGDQKSHKGPFINYVVENRNFLAVCLFLLTTLFIESRQKS